MKQQITTSAALFYGCERDAGIPLTWLERIMTFLEELSLPLTFFSASGGGFVIDECQEFAMRSNDLVERLRKGEVRRLSLDSVRDYPVPRSDWRALASVSSDQGLFYLGTDEEYFAETELLRRAYEITKDIFPIRYGIAYKMALADLPDCYAFGVKASTQSHIKDFFAARHQGIRLKKQFDPWTVEVNGKKRHLSGLFRGVYRANLLSANHVRAAGLEQSGIGTLGRLDSSAWLWEIPVSELSNADVLLRSSGAVVGDE